MSHRRIRVAKVKFTVVQNLLITKEKIKFAKGVEQNFSTVIIRITKFIEASTTRLRAGGFKQDTDRGTILRGGNDSCSNLDPDHLQDR